MAMSKILFGKLNPFMRRRQRTGSEPMCRLALPVQAGWDAAAREVAHDAIRLAH